jgi:DNA-binding LacI/PurR family transcriptional regulator
VTASDRSGPGSGNPEPSSSPEPQRQPTLETVAELAGVSRATVSRVINGSAKVSAQVRAAVQDAIARVDYVPNRAARALVTRRINSIALVVREAIEFGFADPYLSSIVVAASQSLTRSGIHLAVMMARTDDDQTRIGSYVRGGHVDGVILVSVHDGDPLPRGLLAAHIPMVIGGRPPEPLDGVCYVDSDNHAGAALAAHHLLATGRTRLAMIAGPSDLPSTNDRLDGFLAALRAAGQPPPTVTYGSFTRESGERAAADLLRRVPDVDGIFAANDLMAIGALRFLKDAGRRVPDDVAVIGFDDTELARHADPALTTIHQLITDQARLMVELVLSQIEGRTEAGPHILPTHLVRRSSA